jgi:hypothetical protein
MLVPEDYGHPLLVVADKTALASAELPLLVIDLWEERGRGIRVVTTELWGIENNLSLANMDFHEFAGSVDEDGVFRGPRPRSRHRHHRRRQAAAGRRRRRGRLRTRDRPTELES